MGSENAGPGFRVGDLIVDPGRARVTRAGVELPLPKLSFDLMLALIESAPRIATTDALMERLYGDRKASCRERV